MKHVSHIETFKSLELPRNSGALLIKGASVDSPKFED